MAVTSTIRKMAWFAALWIASVGVIMIVAYVIRLAIPS